MSLIEIKNLSFSYESQIILKNVNFSIEENEFVTVVGPNGGGKTTLLRLLLGLYKPQSGLILIDGKNPDLIKNRIGYVPQASHFDKKFPITVFEVVLTGRLKSFGYYSKKDKFKAEEILENVGLRSFKNEHFSNLSGGEMQKMLIARALVTEADILFLDEPTSNIDSLTGKNLNTLLKELKNKMTIILVTHDTAFVANITDRVFCVNRTVIEHPFDCRLNEVVADSYGDHPMFVRHNRELSHE